MECTLNLQLSEPRQFKSKVVKAMIFYYLRENALASEGICHANGLPARALTDCAYTANKVSFAVR